VQIYLLRHADAAEQGPGQSDAERPLTDRGIKQTAEVVAWMTGHRVRAEYVVASPRLRAMQTAEPVADGLGVPMLTDYRLDGGRLTAQAVADLTDELGGPEAVVLVGHEPDLSGLVEELTGGHIQMQKASVAAIWCERIRTGRCTLTLLVPPRGT
jgi:phosphohistidine phosphatase